MIITEDYHTDMITLHKIEKVRRWLKKYNGKTITPDQAREMCYKYTRLADGILKLKQRDWWIINVGKKGKFAKYMYLERGRLKNYMVKGHRIDIINAHYINGFKDMDILIKAYNGVKSKLFTVNSDAFRDKQIMIKHLEDGQN